nr:type II toxin-antitoxin system VapC family toxin [Polymorphobacter sp.]
MVYVLDSSALLAAMLEEPGVDRVEAVLGRAMISAVNLSEVVAKLQERGVPDADSDIEIEDADVTVVSFDEGLAIAAGRMRLSTRAKGLSFGDRACIALGQRLGATVLTADRAWGDLDLGVTIELIR